MKYSEISKICIFIFLAVTCIFSQVGGLKLPTPDVNAALGIGFNYDYLRSPLDVNFENPRGYYSVNIPIRFALTEEMTDLIFDRVSENFTDDEYFTPNIAARQFANTTIRVDVPMLWGVCSFSHMNVMSMKYENTTGIPSFRFNPAYDPNSFDGDLMLLGNLNTPLSFSLGWESMMFGYVYKFNELFSAGVNLHRHRFYFRAKGNIDIDTYGRVNQQIEGTNLNIPIEYSLKNPISGEYSLERWTPTIAGRFWRFDIFARIMFKDEAKGALSGKYAVPFFVDPSNFTLDPGLEKQDGSYIIENIKNGNFMENRTDTVNLNTNKNMKWELPHVLTLKYNIIPEKIAISYSKFIGKTKLELTDSTVGLNPESGKYMEILPNGLDLRMGLNIDHMILFNAKFGWFYGNIGIFSLDADWEDRKNLLGGEDADYLIRYGKGVMIPTLTGGGIIGTKLQVMLELNLLPLTAFKTGLVYNF